MHSKVLGRTYSVFPRCVVPLLPSNIWSMLVFLAVSRSLVAFHSHSSAIMSVYYLLASVYACEVHNAYTNGHAIETKHRFPFVVSSCSQMSSQAVRTSIVYKEGFTSRRSTRAVSSSELASFRSMLFQMSKHVSIQN